MLILVVSDFHLGKGKFLKNGQLNILEDFDEDDRFVEFLEYYSTGKYLKAPVHLVLNGDILNLIQIDHEGIFSHIIDEERTVSSMDLIYQGHRGFFDGMREFLSRPNKEITFIVGNHDAGMAFKGAKEKFKQLVGEKAQVEMSVNIDGVHVEHGHRFEMINTVPPKKYFLEGPNKRQILNLPWGSLFCINVLPRLKKERPYLDKVRPMSAYIKWTVLHDFLFFMRLALTVTKYIIQSNFDIYTRQNRNFKTTIGVLKQITIYPSFVRKAKAILRSNPALHTVVMGHTHLYEWRRFPEGKYYFNSGTWNTIPSIDAGLHESDSRLTYISLDVHSESKSLRSASLNVWQGNWRPFREEISTADI